MTAPKVLRRSNFVLAGDQRSLDVNGEILSQSDEAGYTFENPSIEIKAFGAR